MSYILRAPSVWVDCACVWSTEYLGHSSKSWAIIAARTRCSFEKTNTRASHSWMESSQFTSSLQLVFPHCPGEKGQSQSGLGCRGVELHIYICLICMHIYNVLRIYFLYIYFILYTHTHIDICKYLWEFYYKKLCEKKLLGLQKSNTPKIKKAQWELHIEA